MCSSLGHEKIALRTIQKTLLNFQSSAWVCFGGLPRQGEIGIGVSIESGSLGEKVQDFWVRTCFSDQHKTVDRKQQRNTAGQRRRGKAEVREPCPARHSPAAQL